MEGGTVLLARVGLLCVAISSIVEDTSQASEGRLLVVLRC